MKVGRVGYRLLESGQENNALSCAEPEIVLAGPPSQLVGSLRLKNSSAEPLLLRDLPLEGFAEHLSPTKSKLLVGARLGPGHEQTFSVSLEISPLSPPGEYGARARLGCELIPVKLLVSARREINVSPKVLDFVASGPGAEHLATLTLINTGNVAVQVPSVRHSTALDVDTFCRSMSLAIRKHGDEGFQATLDAFTKGMRSDLADAVGVRLDEEGAVVQPGHGMQVHLTLKEPRNAKPGYEYRGGFRLFDSVIGYEIIPAALGASATQEAAT